VGLVPNKKTVALVAQAVVLEAVQSDQVALDKPGKDLMAVAPLALAVTLAAVVVVLDR
jgi:hypothetical protein